MITAAQSALSAEEAVTERPEAPDSPAASAPGATKPSGSFLSIGEAAAQLDLPAHVLRYWETQFEGLQPLKRSGGRRYYRPEDIVFLKRLRGLLHEQAYTIRGAQRLLASERGGGGAPGLAGPLETATPLTPHALQAALERAVEAGSFDGALPGQDGREAGLAAERIVTRLTDALDLLVEAKGRLDAVRRNASG